MQFRSAYIVQVVYYLGVQKQGRPPLLNLLLDQVTPYLDQMPAKEKLKLLYGVSQTSPIDKVSHLSLLRSHLSGMTETSLSGLESELLRETGCLLNR